ncbi:MAG: response regulator [Ignavibacteriales bacterium]|nr:response regulator [Ignavibacteriales bacterium]
MTPPAAAKTESRKVLVVDDDDAFRVAIVRVLQEEGFTIVEATDGADGLEKATRQNPDLIVSDVFMPNMNGFMMVEELQKDKRTSGIPIIMMTGAAQGAGAWSSDASIQYIEKPFSLDSLLETVRKVLKS